MDFIPKCLLTFNLIKKSARLWEALRYAGIFSFEEESAEIAKGCEEGDGSSGGPVEEVGHCDAKCAEDRGEERCEPHHERKSMNEKPCESCGEGKEGDDENGADDLHEEDDCEGD